MVMVILKCIKEKLIKVIRMIIIKMAQIKVLPYLKYTETFSIAFDPPPIVERTDFQHRRFEFCQHRAGRAAIPFANIIQRMSAHGPGQHLTFGLRQRSRLNQHIQIHIADQHRLRKREYTVGHQRISALILQRKVGLIHLPPVPHLLHHHTGLGEGNVIPLPKPATFITCFQLH